MVVFFILQKLTANSNNLHRVITISIVKRFPKKKITSLLYLRLIILYFIVLAIRLKVACRQNMFTRSKPWSTLVSSSRFGYYLIQSNQCSLANTGANLPALSGLRVKANITRAKNSSPKLSLISHEHFPMLIVKFSHQSLCNSKQTLDSTLTTVIGQGFKYRQCLKH